MNKRQKELLSFMNHYKNVHFKNQEEVLHFFENWLIDKNLQHLTYGYLIERRFSLTLDNYLNLSSGRAFRKDLKYLRENPQVKEFITATGIVLNFEIAKDYLERRKNKILRELKGYHKMKHKLENYYQTDLTDFDKEIEQVLNEQ